MVLIFMILYDDNNDFLFWMVYTFRIDLLSYFFYVSTYFLDH